MVRKKPATGRPRKRKNKPAQSARRSHGARSASKARGASKRGRGPSRKARRRQSAFSVFINSLASAGFFVFTIAIAIAAFSISVIRELPPTDGLWGAERTSRTSLYTLDGAPIPVQGQMHGAPVRLADLPDYVGDAVLSIEDRNFHHHVGVNPLSIIRALIINTRSGEVRQGGSTITQQLAKNLFLSSDKTMRRKLQELYLAIWLEMRFTKDQLLTLYLNRVYFGAGAYGIDAASHRYFGKPARRLELNEAAMLAGLLKAPSRYSPNVDPDAAGLRTRLVLDAMVDAGRLDYFKAEEIRETPIRLRPFSSVLAPYFVDQAVREARIAKPFFDSDMEVRTTLDSRYQRSLDEGIEKGFELAGADQSMQVAAVLMDGAGAIKAMVGGRDYSSSQFNRAIHARRQPGSAFKPFVYLAALEQGASPRQKLKDEPITISGWKPGNYKDEYRGKVTMQEALALSLNAATLRLQEETGRGAVRVAARRMGISSPLSSGAALGLGVNEVSPIELAAAYVPFANGGFRVRPHTVISAADATGVEIYRTSGNVVDVAARKKNIEHINNMMRSVVDYGTGRNAKIPNVIVAGKTGTTQDYRDAWFVGHAEGLVLAVWVGRDDNKPMSGVTGGSAPAIVWRETMMRLLNSDRSNGDRPGVNDRAALTPAIGN